MERGQPLVIGHAGADGEAPANTLAAVRVCLASGADAMEIDVQLTADDVPVLLHDATLDRTTNLAGPIRAKPLVKVEAADAGDGERVPSLADVLALVAGRLTVMCELKATPEDEALNALLVRRVAEVTRESDAVGWSAIHSFNGAIVERARQTAREISAARISRPRDRSDIKRLLSGTVRRGAQAVSIHHSSVDSAVVRAAKQRQLTVWTWTPDTTDEWDRVTAAGVDGIITKYPTKLAEYLAGGH